MIAAGANGASGMTDMAGEVRTALHAHWKLFLIEGIVLLVLGTAAILVPPIASIAVAILLGWLFLVGGIVGLLSAVFGRHAPGFVWSLISAVLAIVAGAALIFWPAGGAQALTLVLTAFLIADGILTIFFALEHRRQLSQRWGWLMVNGVVDLVLAGLIIWMFPGSALWILGLIVGIDFIFGGWSLIAMALAARKAA